MKLYLVTWGMQYDEDGHGELAIFDSRKKAEDYILKKYPDAIKDSDGDFESPSSIPCCETYIYIEEFILNKPKEDD